MTATPAPTDRGERMSTPTPDRSQWSVTVTVPSDLPGAMRDSLFGRVANAAHLWEPSTRDGWDVDVSAGPAASAPQGDTAGVIERAAAIIHKNACDCGPSSGHSAEFRNEFGEPDEGHHETARELAAAGLLAVAASPAAPQAADLAAVERMAHALARRRLEQSVQDLVSDEEAEAAWYRLPLADINEFREDARAVLAALKEGQQHG